MAHPQSITTLPESPEVDRRRRMVRYTVAMSIRMLCIIACLFVRGWWLLLPILGAVVLPYVAVVLANVGSRGSGDVIEPDARDLARREDHP